MSYVAGTKLIGNLINGTTLAAALQTALATAANVTSFAQAVGQRKQAELLLNNPTGLTAVAGSTLASSLVMQSPSAVNIVTQPGSASRPYMAPALFRTGKGVFGTKNFSSINIGNMNYNNAPISIGSAWAVPSSATDGSFNVTFDGGGTWALTSVLFTAGANLDRWSLANGYAYINGANTDASNQRYLWRWTGVGNPSVLINTGSTVECSNVAYGNGKYIMVQSNTTVAWDSADGTAFAARVGIAVNSPSTCYCAAAGVFTVQGAGATGAITADGVTYVSKAGQPALGAYPQIVTNDLLFVMSTATNTSIGSVKTSTDGFNWVTRTLPSTRTRGQLNYSNGVFFFTPSGTTNVFCYSLDGITWVETTFKTYYTTSYTISGYSAARGEIMAYGNGASTSMVIA